MIHLGDYNTLRINRFTAHGAYLDAGDLGEILLPEKYLTPELHEGDEVNVFVYLDQSERLVGTFETPLARVGDFAFLRVAWVNEYGAFLHWGLVKDLFCPFREQMPPMQEGKFYLVHIHIDEESRRIVASAKLDRYLEPAPEGAYFPGKEVEVIVRQRTPLGHKVIVENRHPGLLFADDNAEEELRPGEVVSATVVKVRPDGKVDLSLRPIGMKRFRDFAHELLNALREAGGSLPFTDASDPDAIRRRFGVSKKTFKRAVGTLYRERKIAIESDSLRLLPEKKVFTRFRRKK